MFAHIAAVIGQNIVFAHIAVVIGQNIVFGHFWTLLLSFDRICIPVHIAVVIGQILHTCAHCSFIWTDFAH